MPMTPGRHIASSMRIADGLNATIVFNNDLAQARKRALAKIENAARNGGGEGLRGLIFHELADLAVRERELLLADNRNQQRIAHTTYADEAVEA